MTLISKSTFPTGRSTLTSDEIASVLANVIQSSSAELLLAREYRTLTPREYFDQWAAARSQFGLPMNETIETKPLFGEPAQVFYRRAPSRRPSRRLLCLNQVPCLTRHVTGGDRHRGHWQMRSRCGRIEFGSLPPRLTGSPAQQERRYHAEPCPLRLSTIGRPAGRLCQPNWGQTPTQSSQRNAAPRTAAQSQAFGTVKRCSQVQQVC